MTYSEILSDLSSTFFSIKAESTPSVLDVICDGWMFQISVISSRESELLYTEKDSLCIEDIATPSTSRSGYNDSLYRPTQFKQTPNTILTLKLRAGVILLT